MPAPVDGVGVGVDVPLAPVPPTVPELLPPTVPLDVPVPELEPALPVPMPVLPPVLDEDSRSFRHFSFIVRSLSFSQLAFAAALSVVLPVTPVEAEPLVEPLVPVVAEPEEPVLEESAGVDVLELDDGADGLDELELVDGLDAEPEAPEVPLDVLPEVWATATLVAARKAAAIAACIIFIVIASPQRLSGDCSPAEALQP